MPSCMNIQPEVNGVFVVSRSESCACAHAASATSATAVAQIRTYRYIPLLRSVNWSKDQSDPKGGGERQSEQRCTRDRRRLGRKNATKPRQEGQAGADQWSRNRGSIEGRFR